MRSSAARNIPRAIFCEQPRASNARRWRDCRHHRTRRLPYLRPRYPARSDAANRATWWIITLVGCLIAASYWESELDRLSCLGAAISVGMWWIAVVTVLRTTLDTVPTPGNVGQDGFFSFFSKIKFAVPPWLSSMYPLHRRVL